MEEVEAHGLLSRRRATPNAGPAGECNRAEHPPFDLTRSGPVLRLRGAFPAQCNSTLWPVALSISAQPRKVLVGCFDIIWGTMKTRELAFGPGIIVQGVAFRGNRWVVSAQGKGGRSCPGCGEASGSRHSWQMRRLQELPIQGVPATLEIRSGRWRCRYGQCARKTFDRRRCGSAGFLGPAIDQCGSESDRYCRPFKEKLRKAGVT